MKGLLVDFIETRSVKALRVFYSLLAIVLFQRVHLRIEVVQTGI